MNLNKVILIGRLTADPELKTIPSGESVCNFSIATNRYWTDQATKEKKEKTEYHNIIVWRRLAEVANQYLKKGGLVFIEGRLQTRSWEDDSGNKRYRTEIVAENLQLGPRQTGNPSPRQEKAENKEPEQENIPVVEEEDINVKDIPF